MSSASQETVAERCDLPTGHALPKSAPDDVEPLTRDVLFELLKNRRRRDVLRYLRGRDEVVTLSDLAEHVAALENDIPEAQLSSRQRKRVYVALYQCHLPILKRSGVIEFNQARGTIVRTERAEQLYPYLDEDQPPGTQGSVRFLGLAIAGALAYGISSLVPGLAVLSPLVVGLTLVGFAGLAVRDLLAGTEGSWRDGLADVVAGVSSADRPAEESSAQAD